MANADPKWLTTGAVARLCSVTPDAVQKWIKSGRVAAHRTAGGHYRLALDDVKPFITSSIDECRRQVPPPFECTAQPLRCWEYFAESGEVGESCTRCVVYRIRASWCFEVLAIPGADHSQRLCRCQRNCTDCAYYRQIVGMPASVLLISTDPHLLNKGEPENEHLEIRSASNAYDAAVAVGTFRPAFVVFDLQSVADGQHILDHLLRDSRVPGVRIILCQTSRDHVRVPRERLVGTIRKPIEQTAIAAMIRAMPMERRAGGHLHVIDRL